MKGVDSTPNSPPTIAIMCCLVYLLCLSHCRRPSHNREAGNAVIALPSFRRQSNKSSGPEGLPRHLAISGLLIFPTCCSLWLSSGATTLTCSS
ncbi:hypothetical protein BaRGS_00002378 [Batillaria attramentaria]|uniref:Secreted protein n=1 Tax=Batillaria attramentaria TaxID=370345 RepID=A0ABD0M4J7_9CAEN